MGELKDGILLVVVWVVLVMMLCWFFVEAI